MDQLKFDSEEFLKLGEEQPQANRLAAYLIQQYHPSSIVDVGAATGLYLKPFLEKGVYVQGRELEPIPTPIAAIDSRFLHRIDITREIAGFGFDLCLCLEVLEHIPAQYAADAISNLCSVSDTVIFSAALPGQGGYGHINCQPKDYWSKLFGENKFYHALDKSESIVSYMKQGYHMGWFTQNVMVFQNAIDN